MWMYPEKPVEEEPQPERAGSLAFLGSILRWALGVLRNLVTLLILGGLALWLLPTALKRTVDAAKQAPAASAGYGLLTVIVGYIGAAVVGVLILGVGLLLTAVTLGGLSGIVFGMGFSGLTLLVMLFSLLVVYGSKLVVGYLVGDWIMGCIAPNASGHNVWAMLIGIVIYVILRAIPILGWIIALVVTIIGVGAMWLAYRNWRKPVVIPAEATSK